MIIAQIPDFEAGLISENWVPERKYKLGDFVEAREGFNWFKGYVCGFELLYNREAETQGDIIIKTNWRFHWSYVVTPIEAETTYRFDEEYYESEGFLEKQLKPLMPLTQKPVTLMAGLTVKNVS